MIRERRLCFVESEAVRPTIHLHHGPIPDILRSEAKTNDYFAITAKAPLRHRNAAFPSEYADRDRQMRPLGNRGANMSSMIIIAAPISRDGWCGEDNCALYLQWFLGHDNGRVVGAAGWQIRYENRPDHVKINGRTTKL